ncbi:hypothetical protein KFE96_06490 [Kordiimonas sp. SCSIO 12603]|uniref:DUF6404 family protein n=1 Tax=Kordiimonas sp. SCSIO 12603 TaxID=2829596 RepID=UPI0021065F24|nr:DUF6404 family protein [Kordiimonas sp. SCSIO 12603]UTW59948.1 hypothetical protein KFE96_06490 [Kordiimonas sp. SCSIO 12603]
MISGASKELHEARVDAAIELLLAKGVKPYESYSLPQRLLRFCGYSTRPMYFLHPVWFGVQVGILYALLMTLAYAILGQEISYGIALPIWSVFFGTFMAIFFKRRREKLDLPAWEDIPVKDPVSVDVVNK